MFLCHATRKIGSVPDTKPEPTSGTVRETAQLWITVSFGRYEVCLGHRALDLRSNLKAGFSIRVTGEQCQWPRAIAESVRCMPRDKSHVARHASYCTSQTIVYCLARTFVDKRNNIKTLNVGRCNYVLVPNFTRTSIFMNLGPLNV